MSQLGQLVTQSDAMCIAFEMVSRFAPTDVSVTLLGETGAGKDVLAHALHERSERSAGPFVVFDCGAVAPSLAESELLGHERGSFTGAVGMHAGAFERAHGGTLFLDEIGELPVELQPRLLRALENRRVRRVGGTEYRSVDVRVIAATNRDLRADVERNTFRRDLYYRIAAAVIRIPPLRERREDLSLLAAQVLSDLNRPEVQLTREALSILESYSWPGNVRELKNVLAFASTFVGAEAPFIGAEHIRLVIPEGGNVSDSVEHLPLGGQRLEDIERAAIQQTLVLSEGNRARAAQVLGIAVSTLYEKLRKYGLGEQ